MFSYKQNVECTPWIFLFSLSIPFRDTYSCLEIPTGWLLTLFFRTMKQNNWTESRRVWTKSTPTCARPRKIWQEWKSAAASAFFHATSRAVPKNRFTPLHISHISLSYKSLFLYFQHTLYTEQILANVVDINASTFIFIITKDQRHFFFFFHKISISWENT